MATPWQLIATTRTSDFHTFVLYNCHRHLILWNITLKWTCNIIQYVLIRLIFVFIFKNSPGIVRGRVYNWNWVLKNVNGVCKKCLCKKTYFNNWTWALLVDNEGFCSQKPVLILFHIYHPKIYLYPHIKRDKSESHWTSLFIWHWHDFTLLLYCALLVCGVLHWG